MTTDCIDTFAADRNDHASDNTLHDAIVAIAIAIIFVIPGTLAALSLIG